ncbi:hypothetical protein UFOVP844_50 [uncultured Caudovirales phage]|uniref:Uncharacterized protein n=1 Tax=uncultured Caudovirales phage TaxID=2100421 RepID=A0A6J5PGE4_9CAUD|nr:hypothetical protein UFOVP844_50 [uncultured Caudovirales phage]
MTQAKTTGWTNPASAVVRIENVGFQVSEATTINVTDGGSFYWNSSMPDGYYLDVDAGTITTSNGFTPVSLPGLFGAPITGFTNASPGVIAASYLALFDFAAGDTVMVSAVADDESGTSLNGTFTLASVSSTALTLVQNTSAPTYSVYVSGGYVSRVSDAQGNPIPTQNYAVQGIQLGTGVVGGNSDVMVANFKGDNSVT